MDINVTKLERNIRLFALPGFLMVVGLLASLFLPDPEAAPPLLKEIVPVAYLIGLVAVVIGSAWFAWRLWQLHRWETGSINGDCHSCGGHMTQLSGKHGAYRKCEYCGSKKEGWH